MIRVVTPGDLEKLNPTYETTCHRCGCVFTFQNADVKSDQREGEWINCPTCDAYLASWTRGVRQVKP